jgi:light-independent protochlorophyllide reductase subunit B
VPAAAPVPAAGQQAPAPAEVAAAANMSGAPNWAPEAEQELRKIPFFVRGKARRNTEKFAADQGRPLIDVETLYDAKAHFSR